MSTVRSIASTLACVAALALATPALAEMMNLKANLSPKDEVPPNDSKGSGSLTATFDTGSKKLTWKGTYSGLTGPVAAAHFHGDNPPSPPAPNSAILVPVQATASPFEGSATLTDAQATDLMAGKWYFNVHTAAHKGGEIRGKLTK